MPETFHPIKMLMLNTFSRDWKFKGIKQSPDKINEVLIELSKENGACVTVAIEFDAKENNIKLKIAID